MNLLWCVTIIIIRLGSCTIDYSQKNISCNDIKTPDGFKYPHECADGVEISVYENVTKIASSLRGKATYLPEVISMDDYSIVTRDCKDLKVKCIFHDNPYVREKRLTFSVSTAPEIIISPAPPESHINERTFIYAVVIVVAVVIVGAVGAVVTWHYNSLKTRMERQREAPGFLRYLQTCCGLREGISFANTESFPLRPQGGSDVRQHTDGDIETQANAIRMSSGSDPHDPVPAQDSTPDAVHVDSADPDSEAPHAHGLNSQLSKEGIQLAANGNTSAAADNRASHHRAMNRNLRDDPGGLDQNKGGERILEINIGCIHGDGGPEDHETEGQTFLLVTRADNQGSDMTGVAVASVNKCGSDLGQVSRCFDALDTDVESAPAMENLSIPKY